MSSVIDQFERMVNNFLLLGFATDGILVDREKALRSECKLFTFTVRGEKKTRGWVPGVIGLLDEAQVEEFCIRPGKVKPEEIETRIPSRIQSFVEASEKCTGLALPQRLECISKELTARGIQL